MKKLKIFRREVLTIANRIIISKDSFIQIRNITRIWHGRPEVSVPVFNLIIAFLIGTATIKTMFKPLGILIILGVVAVIGYYIYLLCNYTLNFELSSGEVYAFTSLDREFIKSSYEKVKELINSKELHDGKYEINFNSCKMNIVKGVNNEVVMGENVVLNKGNNNSVHVEQTSKILDSFNTTTEINYNLMNEELAELLKNPTIQANEEDVKVIKEAQECITKKDKKGLKETLKKLSKTAIKIIEDTSSLITVATFITDIILK